MILDVAAEKLETLDPAAGELSDALERGQVVRFPRCPIALPDETELAFMREQLPARLRRKNVSWYRDGDRLVGLDAEAQLRERARAILRAHADRVLAFLSRTMPAFMRGAVAGTTSFRPLQERGRQLSAHASNELVHVDAGAYGATHGDRILRFFVNVNPVEPRVWATRGTFAEVYARHRERAGLTEGPLEPGALNRAFSGLLRATGSTALRMIDTSPYDRLMRRFHNYMKDAPGFRDGTDGLQQFSFAPFSAWMVLTDGVSHACLSGQHALVDTFVIPLANCRLRELSPFHILQSGKASA